MRRLKKLAFIVAMEDEARPLIQKLNLKLTHQWNQPLLPFHQYFGTYSHSDEQCIDILVSLNGKDTKFGVDNIGTEPATLNAYVSLSQFQPDLCINIGTAGGFQIQGTKIGDVFLSTGAFRFHDRRIAIPKFDEYGIGNYPTHSIPGLAQAIGVKEGVITTGNSLDCSDLDWKMMEKTQGSAKEMEAAGIAWVAQLLGIPMIALKSITDLVDYPESTEEQFLKNFHYASQVLQEKALALIEFLCNNPN